MSTEESQRVIEFFQSISYDDAENNENDEAGENGETMEARTFGPLHAYFSLSNKAFTGKVLDPILIKPRGAPCKKRPKAWHDKFNSRYKGNCCRKYLFVWLATL
jgi:hypothetical protein